MENIWGRFEAAQGLKKKMDAYRDLFGVFPLKVNVYGWFTTLKGETCFLECGREVEDYTCIKKQTLLLKVDGKYMLVKPARDGEGRWPRYEFTGR